MLQSLKGQQLVDLQHRLLLSLLNSLNVVLSIQDREPLFQLSGGKLDTCQKKQPQEVMVLTAERCSAASGTAECVVAQARQSWCGHQLEPA